MTASTVASTIANAEIFKDQMQRRTASRKLAGRNPNGLYAFSYSVEIPTTSIDEQDDEYRIVYFPARYNMYLVDMQATCDDLDSHATPTLVLDFDLDDGTTETTLIDDSTIGQGGGSDRMDADGGHLLRACNGFYIGTKVVTAAATAVSATVTIKGLVYVGDLISQTAS